MVFIFSLALGAFAFGRRPQIIFMNSKSWQLAYLLTWAGAAILSLRLYFKLSQGACYFFLNWPWCAANLGSAERTMQTIVVCVIFLLLTVLGWTLYKKNKLGGLVKTSVVWLWCLLILVSGLLVAPFTSGDIIYYFGVGSSGAQGHNPYTAIREGSNPFIFPPSSGTTTGVMYGPLAVKAFSGAYILAGGNIYRFIMVWKLFMALGFAFLGLLVYRFKKILSNDEIPAKPEWALVWCSFPLLIWDWLGAGHFDVLWLAPLILALMASHYKKWWLAAPLLTIAIWVKYIPIFIAPWFVLWWWQDISRVNWKKPLQSLGAGIVLSLLVTVLSWASLWAGPQVFGALIVQSKWAVSSIFSVVYYTLHPLFLYAFKQKAHLYLTILVQSTLLLTAVYFIWPYLVRSVAILRKKLVWQSLDYIKAITVTLLVYLFIWQKSWWPWYAAWLLPLLLLLPIRGRVTRLVAWLGAAPLLFYIPATIVGGMIDDLWVFYYAVILLIMPVVYQLYCWRKNNYDD